MGMKMFPNCIFFNLIMAAPAEPVLKGKPRVGHDTDSAAELWRRGCLLLMQRGHLREAVACFSRASKMDPTNDKYQELFTYILYHCNLWNQGGIRKCHHFIGFSVSNLSLSAPPVPDYSIILLHWLGASCVQVKSWWLVSTST